MSLNVALSSAVSSLLVLEKQMGVTSNNIANANTVGYSEESVTLGESVSGGVGTGVSDLGTTSNVDQFLLASVIQATTQSSQATAYSSLYQSLQTALGAITTNTTGGSDISSQLSTLESDLTTLATTPSASSLDTNVVNDLYNLTSNLNSMSGQIQDLRSTADQDVSNTVDDINTQLNTINALNKKIAQASAQGQSTASYEDLRNNALTALSGDLGVSSYVNSNDQMQIYTTSGQPLLVGDNVVSLSHQAVTASDNTSYANGTINGIMAGKTDITSDITSGKLAAYIQMRDTELPNAQNALDTLAQSLSSTLNSISNQGTANPPPSVLTSAQGTSFSTADPLTVAAGTTIRVAMVDSSGEVQSYQDVDLDGAASVQDVLDDINGAFGNPTPPVASLNASGQLMLTSTTAGQGVAVSTLSGTIGLDTANGAVGTADFSSFFHLNDVITGGSSASTISVNTSLLKNANLFPAATLDTSSTTTPYAGVGASDGANATALANALQANQTFPSATATGTATQSSATNPLSPAVAGSFTIVGGTQPVTVTVTAGMSLSDIAAAINSAAGSSGVQATVVGSGSYQLQITSGGTSLSFRNASGNALGSLGLSSSPSGYLGATTTTFAGYASDIIADVATRASNASSAQTTQSTTLSTLQNNLSSQSGVNTDEETAKLTELQSAYAASAKVVSTVQAMFTALLNAVSSS